MTGFGVFSRPGESPRVGFRSGDGVLDLAPLAETFAAPSLGPFLAAGRATWEREYERVRSLLEEGADRIALADVDVHLPFAVADYVDFYSSLEHATNLGCLFRPDA